MTFRPRQPMGGIYTFPVVALSNIAQATAVMAFVFVNRKDAQIKEVGIPSFISGYLGVTEPAMFGVNLKYLYPFIGAMIASGIMGIVSRSFGVIANSVGVGGIPAFLSMRGDKIPAIHPLHFSGYCAGVYHNRHII